ncbi:dehydrodolichyl diphosphate synthase complex subunit NUS1 [Paramuricea clavata]|uniref:ditrans,polycis-polyprenyl diphosphate synthase [(2E,6E)-farnesyldiphosphate specific] n=1 Tax=Paramuricea clavata TaxID=317549 RepID=A0A6S7FXW2_PARCT|nr:dehydrodolichyl diphosphate synthase complex subunit NUS1 [Paramuricea clavata]
MQLFYRFLHFLVTLIFSLLISFRYYFKLTRRKIRGVFYRTSECDIKNGVATLRSLPRHLTFIVMEKDVDLCILARLVVWSITAGISYISIQTSEGDLDKRKTEFYGEVYQIRQEMSTCDYELHFTDKDSAEQNGVNGAAHKSLRKVHVNILSYHEGKEDVTKAAQTFCTKVKNKEAQSKIMNIEHLSNLLEVNKDFPDPELAITFGPVDSICAYPPWQIRLTEFISIPSLQVMDHTLFLQTLQQYNKCEQRLGR